MNRRHGSPERSTTNERCRIDAWPTDFPHPFPQALFVQQIKIFKSVDTELPEMEKQINRWIRKTGVRVLSITGNLAGSGSSGSSGPLSSFAAGDILIIVHFEIDAPSEGGKS